MATYYSAFFSSGLLASDARDPSTPRAATASLEDPETTPTANSTFNVTAPTPSDVLPNAPTTNEDKPRLRRRRSSLTIAVSPVVALKAPRSAVASVQRQSLVTRSRSGSVTEGVTSTTSSVIHETSQGNAIVGRLRSGSVGTALRSRRVVRSRTAPAQPPPSAPLPDLPPFPSAHLQHQDSGIPPVPRRPLSLRSLTSDNVLVPISTPPISRPRTPMCVDDSFMSAPPFSAPAGKLLSGSFDTGRDYPSPIDTPEERTRTGYFDNDTQMKGN